MPLNTHPWTRLREAREARLMSLDDVAEAMGTSRQMVYYYETGKHRPRPDAAARLCGALGVAPDFFNLPVPDPEPSSIFFRQFKSKVRPKYRAAVERLRLWVRDSVAAIEEKVVFPDQDIPNFYPPSDPRELTADQIESSAIALREHWGFGNGSIHEIIKLVENKGCIVIANLFAAPTESKMEAFSWWSHRGRPFIVIGLRESGGPRRIVDVAHELGHLILHRYVDKRFLDLNPETHKLIEKQAFRFASAFLMPADTFRRSAPTVTLETLLALKPQWHLSVQEMLERARDLEIIDGSAYLRLRKRLIKLEWLNSEPGDDRIPLEEPRLLANALLTLKQSSEKGIGELQQCVGFFAQDFERFAGLRNRDLTSETIPTFQPYVRDDPSLRLI